MDNRRVSFRDIRVMLYAASLLLDCIAVIAGFNFASFFREDKWLSAGELSLVVIAVPLFIMFSIAREAQSVETLENRSLGVRRSLGALLATAICLILINFGAKADTVSRLGFATAFIASAFALIASRGIIHMVFWKMLGGKATAQLLIVDGVAAIPEPFMDVIDVGPDGYWPDVNNPETLHVLSTMVQGYDRVVVACTDTHRRAWALFLRGSDVGGEIILDSDVLEGAVAIGQCARQDTLIQSLGPLSLYSRIQKRLFDLVLTIPLLILLSPLLVMIAIAIRLESPGAALFRQTRVGEGNRHFRIFKFRSMRTEQADAKGDKSTGRDDDRITRVGRILRRTSIDELPQLLNVLRGDMSLVGPRPHALGSRAGEAYFWEVTDHYWLRHAFKPGITGLAQIRGFRGSTERKEDLTGRLRCDMEYASNWSVWNDLMIMLKTVRVVIHKNAY